MWRRTQVARAPERLSLPRSGRRPNRQLPRPLQILPGWASEPPLGWHAVFKVPAAPGGEVLEPTEARE